MKLLDYLNHLKNQELVLTSIKILFLVGSGLCIEGSNSKDIYQLNFSLCTGLEMEQMTRVH